MGFGGDKLSLGEGRCDVAGVTGLEPAASGVTGRRSNQLSYTPKPQVTAMTGVTSAGCTAVKRGCQYDMTKGRHFLHPPLERG